MVTVHIKGYLLQQKLEAALRQVVGDAAWRGREMPVDKGKKRWDMVYAHDDRDVPVEFDGDAHYRDTLKIKADREKDAFAQAHGCQVVRFPYWVQLTTETLWHFFDLEAEIVQDFPHGFITSKVFPASFCELGVERFRHELGELPPAVRSAVVGSLCDRAKEYGIEYVLPSSLMTLLDQVSP